MAWSASFLFGYYLSDMHTNTAAFDVTSDSIYVALFDNTITPSSDVTAANAAYGAGVWASGEVTGTGWSAGGVALTTPSLTVGSPAAGQIKFDSADVSQSGTTLSSIYGLLVYDNTLTTPVADQAMFCVYLSGGPYSTTSGTVNLTVATNGWYYIDYTP